MNSSSRATRRKTAINERASKMRLPVSTQDGCDAADLDRFINAWNAKQERRDQLSNSDMGNFAAQYGGAQHGQVWSDYRKGKRRIPARDKVIIAICLNTRPERIFRSWPKFNRWALLIDALGDHSSAEGLLLFAELVALFAAVTDEQRKLVVEKLHTF